MKALIVALLFTLSLAAPARAQQTPATSPIPPQSLNDSLKGAFILCTIQVLNNDSLRVAATPGMGKAPLDLSDNPPAHVRQMTSASAGANPVYANLRSTDGAIWLVGSKEKPLCQAVISDTKNIASARSSLSNEINSSRAWVFIDSESTRTDQMWVQVWEMTLSNAKNARLKLHVSGPTTSAREGAGPQLFLQVGFLPPK